MEPTPPEPTSGRQRLVSAYRIAGIIALNTLLLLLVVNVIMAWLGLPKEQGMEELGRRVLDNYGETKLLRAYPGWTSADLRQLHQECWGHELIYDSFTGYKERPREGRFVNVDVNGFRHVKDQAVWPPSGENLNVFVFGGSTVFGYGLPDHETIPSQLQEALRAKNLAKPVAVYNLGRGFYYSSQERVFFEKLLVAGIRPDIAIFVDGLNEVLGSTDAPWRPESLRDAPAESVLNRVPLIRFANQVAARNQRPARTIRRRIRLDQGEDLGPRYLRNQVLIRSAAGLHDVRVLFVWQPAPDYHPNPLANPFWHRKYISRETVAAYQWLEPHLNGEEKSPDTLWLAELQEGRKETLYVDEIHYSALFSKIIAERIAEWLVE